MVDPPLKYTPTPYLLPANVHDAVTQSTIVWNHNVGLFLDVSIGSFCWSLVGILVLGFHLHLVESPVGVFTFLQCTFQMLFFFMQQLWVRADGLCSVLQCTNHTRF